MRIPRAHELTVAYCRRFGLPLRPFVMGNPAGLVYVGGVRLTAAEAAADPARLPFELAEGERGRSADALWEEAIADIRTMLESGGEAAWIEVVERYDQYSLYEFLKLRGLSEGAIEYYTVMNFLEADMHNSFVEILREELGGAYVDMLEIEGGMDRLPNAFYAALEDCVRLGVEVRAIAQDDRSVTDLPVRRLNYPTPDDSTSRGVLLASYTWGQDALQWGAMDETSRLEEALEDVAQIHPSVIEEFEVGCSHAWYGDRWARGAFAMFAPEQQTNLYEAIVRPEGRVYFAGEHCSLYHAWIQGSLESGIRAARQIHELPPVD